MYRQKILIIDTIYASKYKPLFPKFTNKFVHR